MALKLIDIAICCLDSSRSRAYLSMFTRLGVAPAQAVMMAGGGLPDGLAEESARFNYAADWYDPMMTPEAVFAEAGTEVFHVRSSGINESDTVQALEKIDCSYILYTGGGIVAARTLASSTARLIHVHPGAVPEYRGSTCFYYSLLDNGTLGASMFFMEEKIDTGPVITVRRYRPNVALGAKQSLFMDHVLDPCLRAKTLVHGLECLIRNEPLPEAPQLEGGHGNCYVAHPVVRAMAAKRLVDMYDPGKAQGLHPL